ncbi:hypothetical protein [Streptomyces sp. NPDC001889]
MAVQHIPHIPSEQEAFARYLRGLAALLDRESGWYAVFRQRDPEGMRECLEGVEVPPWDVVASLLQDLGAARGAEFAAREEARARQLYVASAGAHDRRPGGREALVDRVELMRRELIKARVRAEELARRLSQEPPGAGEAGRLAHELKWTRDDQSRATARLAELRTRLASLPAPAGGEPGSRAPSAGHRRPSAPPHGLATRPAPPPGRSGDDATATGPGAAHPPAGGPLPDTGRGRPPAGAPSGPPSPPEGPGSPARPVPGDGAGATGAGAPRPSAAVAAASPFPSPSPPAGPGFPARPLFRDEPEATGARTVRPPAGGASPGPRDPSSGDEERIPGPPPGERTHPGSPEPGRKGRRKLLRGARFAGGAQEEDERDAPTAVPPPPGPGPASADTPRGARYGAPAAPPPRQPPSGDHPADTAREIVRTLARLRTAGRGGEAYTVLCEAAVLPAGWLPVLAAELDRAGLGADWTTLLWEAASQPLPRVTAIAGALTADGREEDGERLLRQGVTRPAGEIAEAALTLSGEGRAPETRALLAACVQVHSAAEAAGIAGHDPQRLVPPLLDAARAHSRSHETRIVHALRVAGHLTT